MFAQNKSLFDKTTIHPNPKTSLIESLFRYYDFIHGVEHQIVTTKQKLGQKYLKKD